MTRTISHFQGKEPALEKFLQELRFRKVLPFIKPQGKILDLGCGYNGALLSKISSKIEEGVGVDVSVTNRKIANNINLISHKLDHKILIPESHFDLVVCLAVLEHLENPLDILKIAYKALKKGGNLIITTPSTAARPILEFFAFKLGIISKQEIRDHKKYYSKKEIKNLLRFAGFMSKNIDIKHFSFGFNTFAVAKK